MEDIQLSINASVDICVLIPSYNNQKGLIKSLESISYHHNRLCVVVVDDGSRVPIKKEELPNPEECGFATYVVRLDQNQGITNALNAGLQWIMANLKVRYVARLDCADLCHPDRFYKQGEFLDKNPHIGLLGSWCVFLDPSSGFRYTYTTPTEPEAIFSEMHFRNVFIHPTVIFRFELLTSVGFYPTEYPFVEDYALFFKMLHKTKGAIMEEYLVTCEINTKGLSIANREGQLLGRERVVNEFGSSTFLKFCGKQKVRALRIIPYKFILWAKNKMSRK